MPKMPKSQSQEKSGDDSSSAGTGSEFKGLRIPTLFQSFHRSVKELWNSLSQQSEERRDENNPESEEERNGMEEEVEDVSSKPESALSDKELELEEELEMEEDQDQEFTPTTLPSPLLSSGEMDMKKEDDEVPLPSSSFLLLSKRRRESSSPLIFEDDATPPKKMTPIKIRSEVLGQLLSSTAEKSSSSSSSSSVSIPSSHLSRRRPKPPPPVTELSSDDEDEMEEDKDIGHVKRETTPTGSVVPPPVLPSMCIPSSQLSRRRPKPPAILCNEDDDDDEEEDFDDIIPTKKETASSESGSDPSATSASSKLSLQRKLKLQIGNDGDDDDFDVEHIPNLTAKKTHEKKSLRDERKNVDVGEEKIRETSKSKGNGPKRLRARPHASKEELFAELNSSMEALLKKIDTLRNSSKEDDLELADKLEKRFMKHYNRFYRDKTVVVRVKLDDICPEYPEMAREIGKLVASQKKKADMNPICKDIHEIVSNHLPRAGNGNQEQAKDDIDDLANRFCLRIAAQRKRSGRRDFESRWQETLIRIGQLNPVKEFHFNDWKDDASDFQKKLLNASKNWSEQGEKDNLEDEEKVFKNNEEDEDSDETEVNDTIRDIGDIDMIRTDSEDDDDELYLGQTDSEDGIP